jgi:DEAD/DEAH box helicase domain-containing protein
MHTTAAWWTFAPSLAAALGLPRAAFLEGLAGLSYVLQSLAALRCLCDVADLGRAIGDREGRWSFAVSSADHGPTPRGGEPGPKPAGGSAFRPTVFLYERYPGGSGLAEGIHRQTRQLLADALELVQSCACEDGCPSCVGPGGEIGEGVKGATLKILSAVVESS